MAVKKKSKSSYHHGNLRESILEASHQYIRKFGVESLSLREIAKILGVTHSAPNKHFPKKEILLAALVEDGFRMFRSFLENTGIEMETNPREAFIRMGLGYIQFANENPELYRLMFSNVFEHPENYPEMGKAGFEAFNVLHESVKFLQSKGVIRKGDSLELSYLIWSLVHGYVLLSQEGRLKHASGVNVNQEETLRSLLSLLMDGIR